MASTNTTVHAQAIRDDARRVLTQSLNLLAWALNDSETYSLEKAADQLVDLAVNVRARLMAAQLIDEI